MPWKPLRLDDGRSGKNSKRPGHLILLKADVAKDLEWGFQTLREGRLGVSLLRQPHSDPFRINKDPPILTTQKSRAWKHGGEEDTESFRACFPETEIRSRAGGQERGWESGDPP